MRRFISPILRAVPRAATVLAVSASIAGAQVETLQYDHVHMSVPDPQASAQWFHDHIGGEFVDGRTDRLLFGTTRIMWLGSRGQERRPSEGGVIDHLGFSVMDLSAKLAELEGAGATVTLPRTDIEGLFPISFVVDPWGTRLEMLEDPQHLGFHHVHLRDPDPAAALAWYHENFGGVRRTLRGFAPLEGILYPGNVWLLVEQGETFPSQGAAIDHIGWKAIELDAKIAEFTAKGLELTTQRRDMTLPNGQIAFFYVAGPNGARVEFVERARHAVGQADDRAKPRKRRRLMGATDDTSRKPNRRDFLAQAMGLGALLSTHPRLLAQERIPTRPIPGTTESLPIVGFGSSKPVLESPTEGTDPIANVLRMLLEHGGRVIDTSPRTEAIDRDFGQVLQNPDFRDRLFLAAKVNINGEQAGIDQWRQTQRLFGRRTVDLLQVESLRDIDLHWPNLRAWKDSGEARFIGATVSSNFRHSPMETFMRENSPDFVHLNYSPMENGAEERLLPLARDMGMGVLINRPFTNGTYFGMVAGKELPAWAAEFDCETWAQFSLKYVLANPAVTCVLTETTNPEHMEENIQAAFGRFPDEATRRRMRELISTF